MNTPSPDPAIEARIADYTPNTLTPQRWAQLADEIHSQVRGASPHDFEDAKALLVTLCQYLAWRERNDLALHDIAATLEEQAIAAYASARKAAVSKKTVQNELGRLRRLHRRHHGLPDPTSVPAGRTSRTTPYSPAELDALRATGDSDVTRAVDLALDAGVVIPGAHTHPRGYDRATWDRARRAARSAGIRLDSVRLHATWAHHQAQLAVPATTLIRAGLTPRELDAIARAVEPLGPDQLALAR
jgi:hypothetical protein